MVGSRSELAGFGRRLSAQAFAVNGRPMPDHCGSGGYAQRSRHVKPLAKRDPSAPGGMLDDDRAILDDNSEEWIQGSAGSGLLAVGKFATHSAYVAKRHAIVIANPILNLPALAHWLCSYQC